MSILDQVESRSERRLTSPTSREYTKVSSASRARGYFHCLVAVLYGNLEGGAQVANRRSGRGSRMRLQGRGIPSSLASRIAELRTCQASRNLASALYQ